ncbi:unnamed protein product [Chrysoparadoxa australica]
MAIAGYDGDPSLKSIRREAGALGRNALCLAARRGWSGAVAGLLQEGMGPGEREKGTERTALTLAARGGHAEAIDALLRIGGTKQLELEDRHGLTALSMCSVNGHKDAADALMRWGAGIEHQSSTGATPLLLAAASSSIDVVRALLNRGADVNHKDTRGRSALALAASVGTSLEVMTAIIEAGAAVDASDDDGRTPLHCAAGRAWESGVLALLGAGASPDVKTLAGETPLDLCGAMQCVNGRDLQAEQSIIEAIGKATLCSRRWECCRIPLMARRLGAPPLAEPGELFGPLAGCCNLTRTNPLVSYSLSAWVSWLPRSQRGSSG